MQLPASSANVPTTARPKIVIPDIVDRTIPEEIIPQDGAGEGPKLPKFTQKDVSGASLLVKMGQANSKGAVSKKDVMTFENHIRFDFIISKHPIIVQGPNRLRYIRIDGRCGPEFMEVAVSDFIRTYEQWLPLDEFNNCECTRHMWISAFLIRQAAVIRSMAAGTRREGGGGAKRQRGDKDSDGSVKRAKQDFTVRVRGSVAVQAFRLYTGLRDFGDLVKWVDSKAKPKGRRIALLARYKCTLEGEQAEDIGVEAGQMFEGELFDQDSWDSQVENFRLVAPTAMVLLIEVCLVREGEAAGSELDLDAIVGAVASEVVSLFSFARNYVWALMQCSRGGGYTLSRKARNWQ